MMKLVNRVREQVIMRQLFTPLLLLVVISIAFFSAMVFFTETYEYQFGEWKLYYSRFFLIIMIGIVLRCLIIYRNSIDFTNHGSGFNLAIFRILYFAFFTIGGIFFFDNFYEETLLFAQMSDNLRTNVPFFNWLPIVMPFNKMFVTIAICIFFISSFFSMLGYKSRWFMLFFVLTAFYLFAIPNYYGKINHNHHILWVAVILLCSPCFDKLSLDSYFSKRRGAILVSRTSKIYQGYFTILWLMIGIIYFFPGFWKIWNSGMDWIFTDNLKNQMLYKWAQLGDWSPIFRIDKFPILLQVGALFTVVFELFFLPLILIKKTRIAMIIAGVIFHIFTLLFLNIFFVVLVFTYLSFVPWDKMWSKQIDVIKEEFSVNYPKRFLIIPGLLLFFNFCFGLARVNSWPFTIYPTFDTMVSTAHYKLEYIGVFKNKKVRLPRLLLSNHFRSERLWQMERNVLSSNLEKNYFEEEVCKFYRTLYPDLLRIELMEDLHLINKETLDYHK